MMEDRDFGFTEIEHTADWALKVWAPELPKLFALAAQGMYWLTETTLQPGPRQVRMIEVDGVDDESLLVSFLSELLFLSETQALAFDGFDISIQDLRLSAQIRGGPVAGQRKEIKAVTYHNLTIDPTPRGFETTIVFDV
jgi:SHS2 domain-containing protein